MAAKQMGGLRTLNEMKEFAALSAAAQRYIRRALDVAFDRRAALDHWSQSPAEARAIDRQRQAYACLPDLRRALPDEMAQPETDFVGHLVTVSYFDLSRGQLGSFTAYRFLYERLLGAAIRPWLPAGFCGAASLPLINPSQRGVLLKSISEAAATASAWSDREPMFFPDWIEGDEVPAL